MEAFPADTQPVTMPLPVGMRSTTQSPHTISKVSIAERVTASLLASPPPTAASKAAPPPGSRPASGSFLDSPYAKVGAGCTIVALLAAFFLIVGAASALIRGASRAEATPPPGVALVSATPPLQTKSLTPDPTTSFVPTLPVVFPPENSPTASPTPTDSPTPTLTTTPTTTFTPTPTATRQLGLEINLLLAKYKDDSLLVVNRSSTSFPLEPLTLKNDNGGVTGEAWGINELKRGECVAVWKDTGRPKRPDDVECKIVGKRLVRESGRRFWTSTYKVYYDEVEIGSCNSSRDECRVRYPD
jgi:hypothetical protein